MYTKATLITMDGMTKVVDVDGNPEFVSVPLFSEGKDHGKRHFQRDKFRDGEYREVPAKKEKGELKTYQVLIRELAHSFALQGDKTAITLHVHPLVFNKIHREFSGKDPAKDLTYMQVNASGFPVYIRFAPESLKSPTLVLTEDLKNISLMDLVKLKLDQEKK